MDINSIVKNKKLIYKRIAVIGAPGSGKTFLTNAISQLFDGPIFHIDDIYWSSASSHITDKELEHELSSIASEDRWFIDGTRVNFIEERIRRASLIIYLDLPDEECIKGIEEKQRKNKAIHRCEDYEGFKKYVSGYSVTHRPLIENVLSKYSNYRLIRLHSRKEVDSFIMGIKSTYSGDELE